MSIETTGGVVVMRRVSGAGAQGGIQTVSLIDYYIIPCITAVIVIA